MLINKRRTLFLVYAFFLLFGWNCQTRKNQVSNPDEQTEPGVTAKKAEKDSYRKIAKDLKATYSSYLARVSPSSYQLTDTNPPPQSTGQEALVDIAESIVNDTPDDHLARMLASDEAHELAQIDLNKEKGKDPSRVNDGITIGAGGFFLVFSAIAAGSAIFRKKYMLGKLIVEPTRGIDRDGKTVMFEEIDNPQNPAEKFRQVKKLDGKIIYSTHGGDAFIEENGQKIHVAKEEDESEYKRLMYNNNPVQVIESNKGDFIFIDSEGHQIYLDDDEWKKAKATGSNSEGKRLKLDILVHRQTGERYVDQDNKKLLVEKNDRVGKDFVSHEGYSYSELDKPVSIDGQDPVVFKAVSPLTKGGEIAYIEGVDKQEKIKVGIMSWRDSANMYVLTSQEGIEYDLKHEEFYRKNANGSFNILQIDPIQKDRFVDKFTISDQGKIVTLSSYKGVLFHPETGVVYKQDKNQLIPDTQNIKYMGRGKFKNIADNKEGIYRSDFKNPKYGPQFVPSEEVKGGPVRYGVLAAGLAGMGVSLGVGILAQVLKPSSPEKAKDKLELAGTNDSTLGLLNQLAILEQRYHALVN